MIGHFTVGLLVSVCVAALLLQIASEFIPCKRPRRRKSKPRKKARRPNLQWPNDTYGPN